MTLTVERALVGDVVYEEDTHRSAVVRGGNRAEAFLSGCIPLETDEEKLLSWHARTYNLKLNTLPIQLDGPDLEVYADGGDEGGGPSVVTKPQ